MNKIFYWSPFTSKVATVKSVINSAESLNRFFKNKKYKTYILDAVNEWKDFEEEIKKKEIEIIHLNKKSIFNSFKKDGFLRSRFAYWYIFLKSFFPLLRILNQKKPDYLIIHLITSLPLILFIIRSFDTKLILRVSGFPKMTLFRKTLWKFASKNIYKITCPTIDTYNDLSKFSFLKDKLYILSDPILNLREIQKIRNQKIDINEKLYSIVNKKNFLLSIGRFTKQKNFFFYLNCIPEILKIDKELHFLFIGQGEDKKKFEEISKKLNISDKVFILNYTTNVHYFMKNAKALVLPSLWEDPGFVLVEAGFNNCQVISSNCPNGPSEIVGKDGGYLFESNSATSLVTNFNHFFKDANFEKHKKKIILKKRIKRFTSFQHASVMQKSILT
tara:strand:+ start:3181 stop:4344 length:1164 start_codon:yes stop_codon:yes gene_type:complete